MADLCARLLADATSFRAEPIAAATDISQADVALELAIYATNANTCAAALDDCAQWLRWAQNAYGGDTDQANRAACAAAQVEAWAAAVPSGPDLATFQQSTLFPFHGVLGALMYDPLTVGPVADANRDYFAVLGAVAVVLAGWIYSDYQQAHGRPLARVR
jgi:hypothetical protein